MQQPRQMYGLGSLVKSATKAVKGVVKGVKDVATSDLGKTALAAAALYYGGGGNLFGLQRARLPMGPGFQLGNLPGAAFFTGGNISPNLYDEVALTGKQNLFQKALSKIPGGGVTAGILGASALGGMLTPKAEEDVEALRKSGDQGLLKSYLERYYKNLNPDADDETVASFVRANAANGGRMGFASGTEEFLTMQQAAERDPAMFVDTTTSAYGDAGEGRPVPRFLQDKLQTLKEAERGISPKNRIALFKQYLDQALQTGEISEQKYREMLMPFFGKKGEEETQKIEEYNRKFRAYGGRMNYAFGNQPEQNAIQASGIGGLPLNQNPAGITELDLRDNGGFIPPVGVKEKADDIPAMLSNNEFVFTADAVRGMGEGDVNVGAQRMYDMMKKLENGGRV
jgi:hypothetical protein